MADCPRRFYDVQFPWNLSIFSPLKGTDLGTKYCNRLPKGGERCFLSAKVCVNHQNHVTWGAAAELATMTLDSTSLKPGTKHNTPTADPK